MKKEIKTTAKLINKSKLSVSVLPKELLSSTTLTTTPFLPMKPTKTSRRPQREHPPDCYQNIDGVASISKIKNNNCISNSRKFSSNFRNANNAHKLLSSACTLLAPTSLHLNNNNKNSTLKISAATTTTSGTKETTPATSSQTATPASSKSSHRKTKSNSRNGNVCLSATIVNGLRDILTLQRYKRTSAPVHLGSSHRPAKSLSTTLVKKPTKFRLLPSLGATSFFTLLTLVCLETVLLSTVSNCAKSFYMHWNTSNSIFRIDNTDHIIDVNNGNLAFQFDQVHIICPVYEPGTFENETEKYIIYNVSKVEYETCRITNADPRVIAICDKPQKLLFFTISFRTYTPQPGGLEFIPGNDYYFISTSSKDDLYRRIGGRCSTNNMKVVFKVCCAPEEKNKTITALNTAGAGSGGGDGSGSGNDNANVDDNTSTSGNQQHHINTIGINGVNSGLIPGGGVLLNSGAGASTNNNGVQLKPLNGQSGTSINTNIDQFNRIPIQPNGINGIGGSGGVGLGSHGGNGIMLTQGHGGVNMIPSNNNGGGVMQYPGHPGQTGLRINNVPSQHYPSHKNNNNNNDDHFDKHPNEVVKNEELTYNSGAEALHQHFFSWRKIRSCLFVFERLKSIYFTMLTATRNGINGIAKFVHDFRFSEQTTFVNMNSLLFKCNLVCLLSSLIVTVMSYLIIKCALNSSFISSSPKKSKHEIDNGPLSSTLPYRTVRYSDKASINLKNFR